MSKDSGENLSCPADMQSSLRDRIAAAIDQKYNEEAIGHTYEVCLQAADAVIRELGAIPDREFTDQWGHHWEWCGGVTGTWAWRITRYTSPSGRRNDE